MPLRSLGEEPESHWLSEPTDQKASNDLPRRYSRFAASMLYKLRRMPPVKMKETDIRRVRSILLLGSLDQAGRRRPATTRQLKKRTVRDRGGQTKLKLIGCYGNKKCN